MFDTLDDIPEKLFKKVNFEKKSANYYKSIMQNIILLTEGRCFLKEVSINIMIRYLNSSER